MKLEIGKFYKIIFNVNNTLLTYKCEILEIDNNFVTFRDKFEKVYTYNIINIVSFEEIEGGGREE